MTSDISSIREKVDQSKYKVELLKRGRKHPNLKVNGHFIHHPKNPKEEAKKWVSELKYAPHCLVVLYGLGLGYEVRELLKRLQPHDKLIVFEPLDEVVVHFINHNKDLVDKHPIRCVQTWTDFRECYLNCGDWEYIIHAANDAYMNHVFKEEFAEFKLKIERDINNLNVDVATTEYFNTKWQENVLRCIPYIEKSGNAANGKGQWKGRPAIIVSAGPSLTGSLPLLRKAKGKALIIASQTTNRLFEGMDFQPDVMMSFDGDYPSYHEHFQDVVSDVPMIYDPAIYWRCVRDWKGPLSMMLVHPANNWMEEFLEDRYKIASPGPSIACTQLDYAFQIGADPIIFIGQDLSYTGGRFHAAGTHYSEDWDASIPPERQVVQVMGKHGTPVLSDVNMQTFLHWFEEAIPLMYSSCKLINCTPEGALIRGMEDADFEETLKQYCSKKQPVQKFLKTILATSKTPHNMTLFLKETCDQLQDLHNTVLKGLQASELLIHKGAQIRQKNPKLYKDTLAKMALVDEEIYSKEKYLKVIHYVIRPWLGSLERPLDPVREEALVYKTSKAIYANLRTALTKVLPILDEVTSDVER